MKHTSVAAWDCRTAAYPADPPYHPQSRYPEYPFGDRVSAHANGVYAGFRDMLNGLGLDAGNFGSAEWNPFGGFISPGQTVVVKPNLVISEHPLGQAGIEASVAHGSVIRAILDYAFIALGGRGRLVVADSPIKEVDFPLIMERSGTAAVADFYRRETEIGLELIDLRDLQVRRGISHVMVEGRRLPGDPAGYTLVDLGERSLFHELGPQLSRLRSTAAFYENVMPEFHNEKHHIYSVGNTILQADAVISVAKLKTHRKAGVTLSMKNLVGITNEKRALPHHRVGSPSHGGDAVADGARLDARVEDWFRDVLVGHRAGRIIFPMVGPPLKTLNRTLVKPLVRRLSRRNGVAAITEGDWYGNDTVWRMALDLHMVLQLADREGHLRDTPQRRYFSVIDGIVAGEKEGPLYPHPKPCGVLLAGFHPVTVDLAACYLMGLDYRKTPIVREAMSRDWPLNPGVSPEEVTLATNREEWRKLLSGAESPFHFEPSDGWKGHLEREAG